MFYLTPDAIRLVSLTAVILMIPWLVIMLAAGIMRQLKRWGVSHAWGNGNKE